LFCKHKRVVDICQAFERLRQCYRSKRLFVVLDNLHNVHDHPTALALMRKLHIHPVWTPTEASWLNLIEAQFGILKRFTVANNDDPTHAVRRRRIYRYLNYRHRNVGTQDHPLRRIRMIKLERH
jgi:transposase